VIVAAVAVFPDGSGLLTKGGLVVLAVVATAVALRLLPSSWRPRGVAVPALAAIVAFATVRVAADTGFAEWFDHDVFERIGGETDDFPTWLVAMGSAAVVLALGRRRRR